MHVFYEDDGQFKAGHILSEADASLQVESESGKRSKIKRANAIFTFSTPEPAELLRQAEAAAEEIDLQFLWECAPQEEFDSPALAADYCGHAPSPTEQAALLMRLHSAPAYFHRRGKGRYRPAPARHPGCRAGRHRKKAAAGRPAAAMGGRHGGGPAAGGHRDHGRSAGRASRQEHHAVESRGKRLFAPAQKPGPPAAGPGRLPSCAGPAQAPVPGPVLFRAARVFPR